MSWVLPLQPQRWHRGSRLPQQRTLQSIRKTLLASRQRVGKLVDPLPRAHPVHGCTGCLQLTFPHGMGVWTDNNGAGCRLRLPRTRPSPRGYNEQGWSDQLRKCCDRSRVTEMTFAVQVVATFALTLPNVPTMLSPC